MTNEEFAAVFINAALEKLAGRSAASVASLPFGYGVRGPGRSPAPAAKLPTPAAATPAAAAAATKPGFFSRMGTHIADRPVRYGLAAAGALGAYGAYRAAKGLIGAASSRSNEDR
jgi:hypothetical protein